MKKTIMLALALFLTGGMAFAQERQNVKNIEKCEISNGITLCNIMGNIFGTLKSNDILFVEAVEENNAGKMEYIFKNADIDINKIDISSGEAPIHRAIIQGCLNAVKYLKEIKADMELEITPKVYGVNSKKIFPNSGLNAFDLAENYKNKSENHKKIYNFLFEKKEEKADGDNIKKHVLDFDTGSDSNFSSLSLAQN